MTPQKAWHMRAAEELQHSLGGAWRVQTAAEGEEQGATRVIDEERGISLLFHGHGPHRANVILKEKNPHGLQPVIRIERDGSVSHTHYQGRIPVEKYAEYVSLLAKAHKFLAKHVAPPRPVQTEPPLGHGVKPDSGD